MDRSPVARGHLLVVSRAHHRSLAETPPRLAAAAAALTPALVRAVQHALGCHGAGVVSQVGEAASQSVEHFHVHITPRWKGDGLHREEGDRTVFEYRHRSVPREELVADARRISAALAKELRAGGATRRRRPGRRRT